MHDYILCTFLGRPPSLNMRSDRFANYARLFWWLSSVMYDAHFGSQRSLAKIYHFYFR